MIKTEAASSPKRRDKPVTVPGLHNDKPFPASVTASLITLYHTPPSPLNYHSSRDKNRAPLNTKEATPLHPACLIKWGTYLDELKTLQAVAGGEIRTEMAVELWTPQVHPQHALYTGYSNLLP